MYNFSGEIALLFLIILTHVLLFSITAFDLFTKSRRANKPLWLFFIFLIPFISLLVYRLTMRRHKSASFKKPT